MDGKQPLPLDSDQQDERSRIQRPSLWDRIPRFWQGVLVIGVVVGIFCLIT